MAQPADGKRRKGDSLERLALSIVRSASNPTRCALRRGGPNRFDGFEEHPVRIVQWDKGIGFTFFL